jgi:hypothetical protein
MSGVCIRWGAVQVMCLVGCASCGMFSPGADASTHPDMYLVALADA